MYACTHCNTKFSALASQEGDGDEVYEACPNCGNDMGLIDGADAEAFIAQMKPVPQEKIIIRESKLFDVAAWQAERDRREQAEDERLDEYQRIYADSGKAAADEYYLGRKQRGTIDISQIKLTKIA